MLLNKYPEPPELSSGERHQVPPRDLCRSRWPYPSPIYYSCCILLSPDNFRSSGLFSVPGVLASVALVRAQRKRLKKIKADMNGHYPPWQQSKPRVSIRFFMTGVILTTSPPHPSVTLSRLSVICPHSALCKSSHAGEVTQSVKGLSCMQKDLNSSPAPTHAQRAQYNPSTGEGETGVPEAP